MNDIERRINYAQQKWCCIIHPRANPFNRWRSPDDHSMKTTKEALAARLNGREYGDEITSAEEKEARDSNLVVIFGYSDDNTEIRGKWGEELGGYGDHEFLVNRRGPVMRPDRDEEEVLRKFGVLEAATKNGVKIEAKWDRDGYSWTYVTEIPHATFDVMEEGEKFCRGIVFSIDDLPA